MNFIILLNLDVIVKFTPKTFRMGDDISKKIIR